MQLKTTAGQPADIPLDEITRAAMALGWAKSQPDQSTLTVQEVRRRNQRYMTRALDNIESISGIRPEDEQAIKDVMYAELPLGTKEKTDLLYECVEAAIGRYGCAMLASVQQD